MLTAVTSSLIVATTVSVAFRASVGDPGHKSWAVHEWAAWARSTRYCAALSCTRAARSLAGVQRSLIGLGGDVRAVIPGASSADTPVIDGCLPVILR